MHSSISFFFNDTATTEIYTLSLHDALPIYEELARSGLHAGRLARHLQQRLAVPRHDGWQFGLEDGHLEDRKSTRLNSSHLVISYAVFCLKKKNICTSKVHSPTASTTARE